MSDIAQGFCFGAAVTLVAQEIPEALAMYAQGTAIVRAQLFGTLHSLISTITF